MSSIDFVHEHERDGSRLCITSIAEESAADDFAFRTATNLSNDAWGPSEQRSVLNTAVHKAIGSVWHNESQTRAEVERYTTEFVKAVPLFVGARWAAPAAGFAHGLDEVKVGDPLGRQAVDMAAGFAKGYLTKRTFDILGAKTNWGFAQKGIAMGASSRFIDTALTPSNYVGAAGFSAMEGARRAVINAGDVKALGVDVVTFGAAHYLPGFLAGSQLARNPMLASSLTGATFGFTSGALGEMQRQLHEGEALQFGPMLRSGGIEASVMAAAAVTGHMLTPKTFALPTEPERRHESREVGSREPNKPAETPAESREPQSGAPKVKERAGYTGYFLTPEAVAQARDGLVIDGQRVPTRWNSPEKLHVTDQFGVKQTEGQQWAAESATKPPRIRVLGLAVDATGVEALHVSVDGRTQRADGKPYHVTRSLAEGRKASESMAVVERALEVSRTRGTAAGGTAPTTGEADPARYSYRALAPHEQFDLTFEPRFQASDVTPPKPKEVRPPKPEVAFDELPARQQVIAALKETPAEDLALIIATRTPEHRAGSFFEMTPDQLRQELFKAKWEPYNPVDAKGQPIIGDGARGYRATINGGRLGMTMIADLPSTAQLFLIDPKGIGNWSVSTIGAPAAETNHVTMIVGPGDHGKPVVWTFHPGEALPASQLDTSRLSTILSGTGIDTSALPASGPERRIQISRNQLDAINAQLPEPHRFGMAKIETPMNQSH